MAIEKFLKKGSVVDIQWCQDWISSHCLSHWRTTCGSKNGRTRRPFIDLLENIDAFIDDRVLRFCYIGCLEMNDVLVHESLSIFGVKSTSSANSWLWVTTIESKFILLMSNSVNKRMNLCKFLAADSLLDRLSQAIAPLYCMEFLVKFFSGLGRMISAFLLLSRLDFLTHFFFTHSFLFVLIRCLLLSWLANSEELVAASQTVDK